MNISEELDRLDQLRQRGVLSEAEFARAKARLIDGRRQLPLLDAFNALRRSTGERWVGGVCGGIAAATGSDAWLWRLVFALAAFFGGTGIILYALLWIFVPPAETA